MESPTSAVIDIQTAARDLEGETAVEILKWAVEHLAPRLTFATGFGAEGCVIDRSDRAGIGCRSTCSRSTPACCSPRPTRCGASSRRATASRSARSRPAADDRRAGARARRRPVGARAGPCCELRKIKPLRAALTGFDAWITAIRRDQTKERAYRARRRARPQVRPREDQPARDVDPRRRVGAHLRERRAVQQLHDRGFPVDRLRAVHRRASRPERTRARDAGAAAAKKECGLHVLQARQARPMPHEPLYPVFLKLAASRWSWSVPARSRRASSTACSPAGANVTVVAPMICPTIRDGATSRSIERGVPAGRPRRRALGRRRGDARGQPAGRRRGHRARPVRQRGRRHGGGDRVPRGGRAQG